MTARQRVLAALQAGPQTTASLCQPDVGGVRFGGRIHELREDGYEIEERRLRVGSSLYTLVAGPTRTIRVGDAPSAGSHAGAGHKNPWRRAWLCKRCAYAEVDGNVCPRGHLATRGWTADLRGHPVQPKLAAAA